MIFNGILNFLFGPLLFLPSYLSILIISLILSSIMIYTNKRFLWTKEVKELQKKMKELEKKINDLKKEKSKKNFEKKSMKLLEKQSEYMSKYMKYNIKPLLMSIIIALIIIPWLNENYKNTTIFIIHIPLVGGINLTPVWWYIICSLIFSLIGKILVEDRNEQDNA
ncbi:MAG: EMC3/TMCO1 family protein [Candidatus Aenigmatarchaeota archaeon]